MITQAHTLFHFYSLVPWLQLGELYFKFYPWNKTVSLIRSQKTAT